MKDTKLRLILDYPFFGNLALSLDFIEDYSIPTAATNGEAIIWNPDFVKPLSNDQKLWLLLHEISHVILHHAFRRKERNYQVWNIAADYQVNMFLHKSVPQLPPPSGALFDWKYNGWSTERTYEAIYDEFYDQVKAIPQPTFGAMEGDGESSSTTGTSEKPEDEDSGDKGEQKNQENQENSDEQEDSEDQGNSNMPDPKHLKSSQDFPDEDTQSQPLSAEEQEQIEKAEKFKEMLETVEQHGLVQDAPKDSKTSQSKTDSKIVMAERVTTGSTPGDGASDGIRELVETITSTEVPWSALLSNYIDEVSTNYYNWMIPNHRYSFGDVIMPTLRSDDEISFAIAIDVSGSIDKHLLSLFMKEFKNLTSTINYKQISCVSCSTDIYNFRQYTKYEEMDYEAVGNGGTSFYPVFNKMEQENVNPSCLIYFTDLECSKDDFGEDPGYPVLWIGDFKDNWFNYKQENLPFGTMIDMHVA